MTHTAGQPHTNVPDDWAHLQMERRVDAVRLFRDGVEIGLPIHPPPITNPMGKYWQQPPVERVLIDDDHALMTMADFEQLLEYSSSIPTGTYPGKMWKRDEQGVWWLGWFTAHPTDPKLLRIHWRRILVV